MGKEKLRSGWAGWGCVTDDCILLGSYIQKRCRWDFCLIWLYIHIQFQIQVVSLNKCHRYQNSLLIFFILISTLRSNKTKLLCNLWLCDFSLSAIFWEGSVSSCSSSPNLTRPNLTIFTPELLLKCYDWIHTWHLWIHKKNLVKLTHKCKQTSKCTFL